MEDLTDVFYSPMPESDYVKPFRLNYTQAGRPKNWDLLEVHDSVAVIIFNVTRKMMVFVKQFRPAVYFNSIPVEDRIGDIDTVKYPASLGVTLELCAGIIDKNVSTEEIACSEVLEETGYQIKPTDLYKVMCYRAGVGEQGSVQTLFYVEVSDSMKVKPGGGIDDEVIELLEMGVPEVERFLAGPPPGAPLRTPPSALYGLSWFLLHRAHKFRKSDI